MEKVIKQFYQAECTLFRNVNNFYEHRFLNSYFKVITHVGGATFTIASLIVLMSFSSQPIRIVAAQSLIALILSHIPVAIAKKIFPRKRPYITLDKIYVTESPLKDHSFPSGHTTAIFSAMTPFIISYPLSIIFFLPLGISVGISRIYLGLHYPSDVLVGMILGITSGALISTLLF